MAKQQIGWGPWTRSTSTRNGDYIEFEAPMFVLRVEIEMTGIGTTQAWNWRVRMRARDGSFDAIVGRDHYLPTKWLALDRAIEFVGLLRESMRAVVDRIDSVERVQGQRKG